MSVKACSKCGEIKPLDEYHRDAHAPDGHAYKCKPCARQAALASWYANYDKRREVQRQHLYDPGRMEKRRVNAHLHRLRHPEKAKAREMVNRAIRDGKLHRQPCEKCGEPRSTAHHEDYTQPLNVRWICSRCHGIEHRRSPEGKAQARSQ